MNIIKVTAAELLPGDDNGGEIVATVDVQGAKTFLTYEDDDCRIVVPSNEVRTVRRAGGVSTVTEAPVVVDHADARAARLERERVGMLAAAAETERRIQNEYRREEYARRGRR